MRRTFSALRRVLIIIGSLTAAWLVVSMFAFPLLQAVLGRPDVQRDPAISTLVGIVVIVLGGLIYRDILRRESPGTHETTPTSSVG